MQPLNNEIGQEPLQPLNNEIGQEHLQPLNTFNHEIGQEPLQPLNTFNHEIGQELLQPLNTFNHKIGQFVNMNFLYFCYFGYYTASFFLIELYIVYDFSHLLLIKKMKNLIESSMSIGKCLSNF